MQTGRIYHFETYVPVVQWSTVRTLLTLILANGWATKQVDYTNIFAQVELAEEIYMELTKGCWRNDKLDMVLR